MHVFLLISALTLQSDSLPLDRLTPAMIDAYVDRHLAEANASLERLLRARGRRTVENTLRSYDTMRGRVNGTRVVHALRRAHPDSAIRAACERAESRLDAFTGGLRLDPRVYRMILAIDTSNIDAETREYLLEERTAFRRAGVDRDDATRTRIAALRGDLTRFEQRFEANIAADATSLAFENEAALAGMGEDWIAARQRGTRGEVIVVGEELQAATRQATDSATRARALVALWNRAPANRAVLDSLLRARQTLATLLGYGSWAAYQLETSMANSPDSVRAFLDALQRMAAATTRRDFEARRGARSSIATSDLTEAQTRGFGGIGPALRPYFPYAQVRDGLFGLARDLLGLEFRPAKDSPGWNPTVETYRVYDGGRLIAKVYLDLRAGPGRSMQGASTGTLRGGVRGGPPVEAVILGGMVPRAEPGLMGPQGVVTLFHEFGHLLHVVLSVRPYYWTSGAPPEGDFREVPSTLFEEWARDTAVLHRIARHYQTGAPAPDSLLVRMGGGTPEGSAIALQWRARMSLELHAGSPDRVDSIVRATFVASQPPGVDVRMPEAEIHPEDTFFHLSTYEASYYTYLWSAVISQDLISRFDRGLLDTAMVRAYRRELLDVGGSRPAMESLRAFLGRPFNLDAWTKAVSAAPTPLRSTIAFVSTRHDSTAYVPTDPQRGLLAAEIYLMNGDGTNPRRLTENAAYDGFPALSPDGSRVVFDSNRRRAEGEPFNTADLFVMNADGSGQTFVSRGTSATWSPDGKQIAFHASASGSGRPIKPDPGAATSDNDIFILSLSTGAKPKNLTNSPAAIDDDPDWSPNGRTIVFTSHAATDDPMNSSSAEIYAINADGTGTPSRLTSNTEEERGPAWSPDGRRIVYSCRRGGPDFEICIMNADGTGQVQLTNNDIPDLTPSWSPDGTKIVCHRRVGGRGQFQLYVINADGTGEVQLTFPPGINAFPNWAEAKE